MTLATYVPADYSLEAFEARRLDYGLHLIPLETFGRKEYVLNAVSMHNDIVRGLAAERGTLFVDQARLLANQPRYFNDPCHFTAAGSARFVEHIVDVLAPP